MQLDDDMTIQPAYTQPLPRIKSGAGRQILALTQGLKDDLRLALLQISPNASSQMQHSKTVSLADKARTCLDHTHKIFQKRGESPEDLSAISRRAYTWIVFLNQPGRLEQHLETSLQLLQRANSHKTLNGKIQLELYNTPYLYQVKSGPKGYKVTIQEAFQGAPVAVLEALLGAVQNSRNHVNRQALRAYASGPQFTTIFNDLACRPQTRVLRSKGHTYDLQRLFDRINREYFNGSLTAAGITWSRRPLKTSYGSYRPEQNLITINCRLDSPDVPEFVVDFVLYHEMLHLLHRGEPHQKRQRVHHQGFRAEEKAFSKYNEASAFLKTLSVVPRKRNNRRLSVKVR